MPYQTLISAEDLSPHLGDAEWAIVDCRAVLNDPEQSWQDYQQAHIPGAVYADLNEDLSGPIIPGQTGRHPLPEIEIFTQTLSKWGIDSGVQVVAYDDAGGSLAAARLWWMLRWLGHETVAVLDGGWSLWQREGYPTRSGVETRPPRVFTPRPRPELSVNAAEVMAIYADSNYRLLDARSSATYRGEDAGYDPVAGHIPGAISAPRTDNLDLEGRFRPAAELRAHYQNLLGSIPPEQVVCYCGSGVTAAHDVLALVHAGLGEPRLYGGSWSDWITDSKRPVELG